MENTWKIITFFQEMRKEIVNVNEISTFHELWNGWKERFHKEIREELSFLHDKALHIASGMFEMQENEENEQENLNGFS